MSFATFGGLGTYASPRKQKRDQSHSHSLVGEENLVNNCPTGLIGGSWLAKPGEWSRVQRSFGGLLSLTSVSLCSLLSKNVSHIWKASIWGQVLQPGAGWGPGGSYLWSPEFYLAKQGPSQPCCNNRIVPEPKIAQGSTGSFNKCSKSSCTWQDLRLVEGRNGYHNRCQFSSMCTCVYLCFYGLVKHHQSHPRCDSNSKYSCMSCFKKYIYRALIFQARGERAEAANDAWWKDISFYIRKLTKIISISFDVSHMFGEMYNTSAYCKKFCFFC